MGYGQSTAEGNQEDDSGPDSLRSEEELPYTSVHISRSQICSICRERRATGFCACADTTTFLCAEDWLLHNEEGRYVSHTILPIRALSPFTEPEFYERMRHRSAVFTQGKDELLENLRFLDACSLQYTAEINGLVDSLYRHRDSVLAELQERRNRLENEIWEAINTVADSLTHDSPDFIKPLAAALHQYQPGHLALFYYKIDVASLVKLIGSSIWYQVREPKLSVFEDVQMPIAVLSQEVKYFDIVTCRWEQLFPLRHINVDERSASTFVEGNNIFVCGGGKHNNSNNESYNTAYILAETGATSLPQMATKRSAPGILYDPISNAVYVFGGINAFGFTALRSCEKYDLSTSVAKFTFDASCQRLYQPLQTLLCCLSFGGGIKHISVETYHIQSNTFTLLPELELPGFTRMGKIYHDAFGYTAVAQSGNVVIISESYLCKWNLEEQSMSLTERPAWRYAWSRCTPVVRDGVAYIVNLRNKTAQGIDLVTGGVKVEGSYS